MKKQGILNSDISRVLSYMGHTDTLCIGDCGLPIPDEVERIDLALCFGEPTFIRTLEIVAGDMKVEKIVLAEEIKEKNPDVLSKIQAVFAANDEMALGAVEAISGAGKDILVVGFDATDDAIAAINEGRMAATIAQQPDLIGKTAVENAVKLIAGEAIEAVVPVEVALVTAE